MFHLLTLKDINSQTILEIIEQGLEIKRNPRPYHKILQGKTLAMLFQKTSTRTRCSFEAAMTQLGGHAQYLDWQTTNFTLGSLEDEIRCLARYVDIIMARVNKHRDLEVMAKVSSVPVINGLSDKYHPCQILADLMTIKEKKGNLKGVRLTYIGDGNNVCHSLILGCAKLGLKIKVATPREYQPEKRIVQYGQRAGVLKLLSNPKLAVKGTDIVYTDTWVSMGQEAEREKRIKAFQGFQINQQLFKNSPALIMHCLPAHRGYEITGQVLDSKNSIVFDQAENRLHIQKAIILKLLNKF